MPTPSRSTFGEALIVITVLAGFFWSTGAGKLTPLDPWSAAGYLAGIVLFYFGLLFARMLFFWMTGGDHSNWVDWQKVHHGHAAQKKK